jgi:hypothetical protein
MRKLLLYAVLAVVTLSALARFGPSVFFRIAGPREHLNNDLFQQDHLTLQSSS